jgi:type IV pilus biogenesis protein CpaD/CtpE
MSRRLLVVAVLAAASGCAHKSAPQVAATPSSLKVDQKDCSRIANQSSEPVFVVDGVVMRSAADSLSPAARDSARIACARHHYQIIRIF